MIDVLRRNVADEVSAQVAVIVVRSRRRWCRRGAVVSALGLWWAFSGGDRHFLCTT